MSKSINDISFVEMLPSSIAGDEKIQAAAQALDAQTQTLNQYIEGLYLYSRIDELDEDLLKHLAWQWHVDFWDDALSITEKRILVKQAYAWHKRKGTPSAIEEVVEMVLGGGYIEEWWEYGGDPYYFRVYSYAAIEEAELAERLIRAINLVKNTRSHLENIIKAVSITGNLYLGGPATMGILITIPKYEEK